MVKKLTAGVLQGTSYTENMEVEWNGQKFEVEIRALSNKETTEIQALMQEGIAVKGKPGRGGKMERVMDFDTKRNLMGLNKSNVKAVAFGTTDESITEKVVEEEFPHKLINDIGNRVKEISGLGNKEDIEDFSDGRS